MTPTRPRLCFSIPASPNDKFYSQLAMFRMALDALGGIYKEADMVISLGDEEIRPLPDPWKPYLGSHCRFTWASPELYRLQKYNAQGEARWNYDYDEYEVVIFCDADTLLIRSFDEVLKRMRQTPSAMGVIAHYPFPLQTGENSQTSWTELARQFAGKPIEFNYRYTLVSNPDGSESASCPFYVNFGFVALTPKIIKTIRNTFREIRPKISAHLKDPFFLGQIALTLSLLANDIPTQALALRYNFPNDPKADQLHPRELKHIALLHYLRTDQFDRQVIFTAKGAFKDFLSLKLEGSNKIFQNHVRRLTHGRFPFSD